MKSTYIIQQLFGDEWQPICNADDLRGIIENLIDMNNEAFFMEEPGKWRLVHWVEGKGTTVIYDGARDELQDHYLGEDRGGADFSND